MRECGNGEPTHPSRNLAPLASTQAAFKAMTEHAYGPGAALGLPATAAASLPVNLGALACPCMGLGGSAPDTSCAGGMCSSQCPTCQLAAVCTGQSDWTTSSAGGGGGRGRGSGTLSPPPRTSPLPSPAPPRGTSTTTRAPPSPGGRDGGGKGDPSGAQSDAAPSDAAGTQASAASGSTSPTTSSPPHIAIGAGAAAGALVVIVAVVAVIVVRRRAAHRKNVAASAAGDAAAAAHHPDTPSTDTSAQLQEAEHAAVDIPVKLASPRA